jgi:hypothetical protein
MVSTIQLHENVKKEPNRMKRKANESYEDIIVRLIRLVESQKREREELMVEGCKEMAEDNLRIVREWEILDNDMDWEWDENTKR